MISSIRALSFIKIQPNMSEQEKKRQRIYDLLNAETKSKFLCLLYTKQKKKIIDKRALKGKGEVQNWTKTKRTLFNCSR